MNQGGSYVYPLPDRSLTAFYHLSSEIDDTLLLLSFYDIHHIHLPLLPETPIRAPAPPLPLISLAVMFIV